MYSDLSPHYFTRVVFWLYRFDDGAILEVFLLKNIIIIIKRKVVVLLWFNWFSPQQCSFLGDEINVSLPLGQVTLQILVVPQVDLATALQSTNQRLV